MRGVTTRTDMDNDSLLYHETINKVVWKGRFKPLVEHSHTNVPNIYKPVTYKLKEQYGNDRRNN
jgi:hypothetical protein